MRVAAVGDLHVVPGAAQRLRPLYQRAAIVADLLLLAGDLTNGGDPDSAAELCAVVGDLDLPVVAVLGNHDHDAGAGDQVAAMLGDAGAIVLEGTAATIETSSGPVGVAGVMGFADRHGSVDRPRLPTGGETAAAFHLRDALASLDTDVRIALTHYAPVLDTLAGEAPEIHRHLGSTLLGDAIDGTLPGEPPTPLAGGYRSGAVLARTNPRGAQRTALTAPEPSRAPSPAAAVDGATAAAGDGRGRELVSAGHLSGSAMGVSRRPTSPARRPPADRGGQGDGLAGQLPRTTAEPTTSLAVHGHVHHGQELGRTPGGTPVRNVARPVIVAPFAVYRLPGGARIG